MGRRRKHHGGSRLASDQIPGQNQNNNCLRPCHSLWYHHQAFRDDTQVILYSSAPSNASDNTIPNPEIEVPQRSLGRLSTWVFTGSPLSSRERGAIHGCVPRRLSNARTARHVETHRSCGPPRFPRCGHHAFASGHHGKCPALLSDAAPTGERLGIQHESQDHLPRMA